MNKANERSKTKRNIDKQTDRQGDRETVTHAAQYKQTNTHIHTLRHAHSQPGRQRQQRQRQRQRQQQRLKEPRKTCKLRVIEQIKVKQRRRQREMERGGLAGREEWGEGKQVTTMPRCRLKTESTDERLKT